MFSPSTFLQGLGLGASLIMPIGAQNAHVIRTAVRRRHVLLTIATCIAIDVILIGLGMAGFGALVESSPALLSAARWGGALFLLWYGLRCLRGAWQGGGAPGEQAGIQATTAAKAFGIVLAMSLLNPHVYLDTVVLLGAVGSSLAADHRGSFTAGAMLASLLWFSGLGLVAWRFAFVLARPAVWCAIEAFTGLTMLVLVLALLLVRAA